MCIWGGIERSRLTIDWTNYRKLDPDFLSSHWFDRRDLIGIHLSGSFLIAVSWVLLTIPFVQVAWIMSDGGKRMLWLHSTMVILCVAASTTEFVSRLMHVGAWNAADWLARDFYLDDWRNSNTVDNGAANGIGWKSVELSYQITEGMILWIDGFEYFALFGILILNFISCKRSSSGLLGNEMCLAGTGFVIGCLSLVDFFFLILRFKNWDTYNLVSIIMTVLIRLVLLPGWLMLLSIKLPPAVQEFGEQRAANRNIKFPSSPRAPTPPVFTIGD